MTQEERIKRAGRVLALLQNEDMQAAMNDCEADILDHMKHTTWDEARMREVLHAELRALARLRYKLQSWADELLTQ